MALMLDTLMPMELATLESVLLRLSTNLIHNTMAHTDTVS
jgi:hypothetical protein